MTAKSADARGGIGNAEITPVLIPARDWSICLRTHGMEVSGAMNASRSGASARASLWNQGVSNIEAQR